MKLSTEIKPRSDGTLSVVGEDGKTYVFKGEPLECDIEHEPTVARLLKLDTFFPANDDDQDAALALLKAQGDGLDDGDDGDDDGELDDDGDLKSDPNALPLEANTAPKAPAPTKPPKGSRKPRNAS